MSAKRTVMQWTACLALLRATVTEFTTKGNQMAGA
jgi:hypothetical protein